MTRQDSYLAPQTSRLRGNSTRRTTALCVIRDWSFSSHSSFVISHSWVFPLFGQLPDPQSFASLGWVVVILVALITGTNQAIRLLNSLKDKPTPLEVRTETLAQYVSKEFCAAHHAQIEERLSRIETEAGEFRGATREDLRELREMIKRLHDRLDPLMAKVNFIAGRVEDPGAHPFRHPHEP